MGGAGLVIRGTVQSIFRLRNVRRIVLKRDRRYSGILSAKPVRFRKNNELELHVPTSPIMMMIEWLHESDVHPHVPEVPMNTELFVKEVMPG